MCIVKKRSLNTLFISSLLNLFLLLLLSEKSNSIDEIIFSYSVLIDTFKINEYTDKQKGIWSNMYCEEVAL